MYTKKLLASILIPSATIVVERKDEKKKGTDDKQEESFKCRPSELPIYVGDSTVSVEHETQKEQGPPNFIEKSIGSIRLQVVSAYEQVKHYKDTTEDYISEGVTNAQWLVDYLGQDSADPTHKVGAIAVGGMAGLILGLRGGLIRRTLFTGIGAIGMASICYPKEVNVYANMAMNEAHNYATIGYNFAYGVKADDPPLELPKIPTSDGDDGGAADANKVNGDGNDANDVPTNDPDDNHSEADERCVKQRTATDSGNCQAEHEICSSA